MSDVFDKQKRSQIMKAVKSSNTKPEMIIRRYLYKNGFRYRLHDKNLPGKPDIKIQKFRTVIFINGCFWHGHIGCPSSDLPKSNTTYWATKISRTSIRDTKNHNILHKLGWRVLVIWECEIKKKNQEKTLNTLLKSIQIGA